MPGSSPAWCVCHHGDPNTTPSTSVHFRHSCSYGWALLLPHPVQPDLCSHVQSPEASASFCTGRCRSPAWSTRRESSQRFTQSQPGILMKYCSVLQVWKPNKLNEFLKVTGGVDSNFRQSPADWHLSDRLTVPLHFDSLAAGGKADWGLKVKQLHFNFAVR